MSRAIELCREELNGLFESVGELQMENVELRGKLDTVCKELEEASKWKLFCRDAILVGVRCGVASHEKRVMPEMEKMKQRIADLEAQLFEEKEARKMQRKSG